MIGSNSLRASRDKRVNDIEPLKLKDTLELYGYFPEANIIPPFVEVRRKMSGITNTKITTPITHFVTKSSQQWRDFKVIRPENHTNASDLIIKNWSDITPLLKKPEFIYSYSTVNTFDAPAYRSGKQIAGWSKMQQQLLSCSSKYRLPILLTLDIQSCYHTMYTHSIEWALKSIGQKELGFNLDKSIRRGNVNRTHGLPVGVYTSDVLAEIVLSWVDTSIEDALNDVPCMGFRFKDNYYFLCEDPSSAQQALSVIATKLREAHFTVNDSKTDILPFVEYHAARWQADYDYLLESLQISDGTPTFTNRKLKVFVEQAVQLSLRFKNEKSILEKAIDLLTKSNFTGYINYKWLFFAISNMLPLRTMSYPKLLVFMKKIATENWASLKDDYYDFMLNEVRTADHRVDLFALLWLGYLLKDCDSKTLGQEVIDIMDKRSSESLLVKEMYRYLMDDTSNPILWEDNKSRLDFVHSLYMNPDELTDYLGVSFGES